MTERTYQVGDVVAWPEVPRGAMVRSDPGTGLIWYEVRVSAVVRGDVGFVSGISGDCGSNWWAMGDAQRLPAWIGWSDPAKLATIIALDVPADATADDLRALAERFEIREHLMRTGDDSIWFDEDIDDLVPRLHRAGWRPGMTAEDAARLLAEVGR